MVFLLAVEQQLGPLLEEVWLLACHSLEGVTHPQRFQVEPSEKKHRFCLGERKGAVLSRKEKAQTLSLQSQKRGFSCFIQATNECRSHIVVNPQHTEKSGASRAWSCRARYPGDSAPLQTSPLWVSCRTLSCARPSSFCPVQKGPCENRFFFGAT